MISRKCRLDPHSPRHIKYLLWREWCACCLRNALLDNRVPSQQGNLDQAPAHKRIDCAGVTLQGEPDVVFDCRSEGRCAAWVLLAVFFDLRALL